MSNLQPNLRRGIFLMAFPVYYTIINIIRGPAALSSAIFTVFLLAPLAILPALWLYRHIATAVIRYIQSQLEKNESIVYYQRIFYKLTDTNGKSITNIFPISLGFSNKTDLLSVTDEDIAYLVLTNKNRMIIGSRLRKSESPTQRYKIILAVNKSDIRRLTFAEANSETLLLKKSPGIRLEIYQSSNKKPLILEMASGGYNGGVLFVNKYSADFRNKLELFLDNKVKS